MKKLIILVLTIMFVNQIYSQNYLQETRLNIISIRGIPDHIGFVDTNEYILYRDNSVSELYHFDKYSICTSYNIVGKYNVLDEYITILTKYHINVGEDFWIYDTNLYTQLCGLSRLSNYFILSFVIIYND